MAFIYRITGISRCSQVMESNVAFWLMVSVLSFVTEEALTDAGRIDVLCDSSGMHVRVRFPTPFNGIVYSKGYQNETSCRYLTPQSAVSDFTFHIPISRCGTQTLPLGTRFNQVNTVVFQNDPVLQTSMDYVHLLSCDSSLKTQSVTHASVPLTSGSSGYVDFSERTSKIWMEVKRGTDPFSWSKDIGNIKVGDEMVVIIHISNISHTHSARIISCEARDEQASRNATVIKLLDDFGCPLLPQIFSSFEVTHKNNALVSFSRMIAFRFSEKERLFLSCGVEICPGYCHLTCHNISLSNSHSSIMPESEFSKRSVVTSDKFSTHNMKSELAEQQNVFNASIARRVMQETIEALSSELKPPRFHRRLESQSRKTSPGFKRRYTQRNEHRIASGWTTEAGIRATINVPNSEERGDSNESSYRLGMTSTSLMHSTQPETRDIQSINAHEEKPLNIPSSSIKLAGGIDANFIRDQTLTKNVTVTKGLSVLPADVVMEIDSPYLNEALPYCFSPVKLTVIISCLLFLVLCLFIACLLLTLKVKKMNRNNSISRFLLYPYS